MLTNAIKAKIDKQGCQLKMQVVQECGRISKPHIVCEYSALAQKEYKGRHGVAKAACPFVHVQKVRIGSCRQVV